MPRRTMLRTALFAVACWCAAPQVAVAQEEKAVVGVVQQFFDAMSRGDAAASRAVLVPGAHLSSMRTGTPSPVVGHQSDTAFIARIGTTKQKLLERMWSPTVSVNGGVATLRTPYDFHIDGKFSHCGTDVFDLLRTAAGWQIVSIVYTVQREGCEPSPLGPPQP